ncbi:MAG: trans-sulfuration enzyme family protein [Alphaproteobacteria bacterium]
MTEHRFSPADFPCRQPLTAEELAGLKPDSLLVHGGQCRTSFQETSESPIMSSGYIYASAEEAEAAYLQDGWRFVYSRARNPTVKAFEDKMAVIEGYEHGFATASGMAAVHVALMSLVKAGDRVVAPYALFGSCLYIVDQLLPRYGVEVELIDGTDPAEWQRALAKKTTLVFLETPANPTLEIIDLALVVKLAHAAGAKVIVDNVFATPIFQRCRDFGVDVVVYSATKHIDGQGRALGGVILCDTPIAKEIGPYIRNTGPSLSPFHAWIYLKSLDSLALRVRQQTSSAMQVAEFLSKNSHFLSVVYPGLATHPQHELAKKQMSGFGNMIALTINGGRDAAFAFMNKLRLLVLSNNLGDSKSLLTHPFSTTHFRLSAAEKERAGITPGLLRLSVGLEDPQDIIHDIEKALG